MKGKYICPECKKEVKVISSCGQTSYFCENCKKLISSKKIIKGD